MGFSWHKRPNCLARTFPNPEPTAEPADFTPDPKDILFLQRVCGKFLYYSRAVNNAILCALSRLSTKQQSPTKQDVRDANHLLDFLATTPDCGTTFYPSDMQLAVHADSSFLSEPRSRSRAAVYENLIRLLDDPRTAINGAVDKKSTIIPVVCASAHEAEYAAYFIAGQSLRNTRQTLADLGYPQKATPLIGDNQTAVGVANRTKRQRRSKSMHMKFHWVQDLIANNEIELIWAPGSMNHGDFFSKAHPNAHFTRMRPKYAHDITDPPAHLQGTPQADARGCVGTLGSSTSRHPNGPGQAHAFPGTAGMILPCTGILLPGSGITASTS